MALSVSQLADKALARRSTFDRSVGMPLVVIKTIEAQGVRNSADVKRLSKDVLAELRRRAASKRRARQPTIAASS